MSEPRTVSDAIDRVDRIFDFLDDFKVYYNGYNLYDEDLPQGVWMSVLDDADPNFDREVAADLVVTMVENLKKEFDPFEELLRMAEIIRTGETE